MGCARSCPKKPLVERFGQPVVKTTVRRDAEVSSTGDPRGIIGGVTARGKSTAGRNMLFAACRSAYRLFRRQAEEALAV